MSLVGNDKKATTNNSRRLIRSRSVSGRFKLSVIDVAGEVVSRVVAPVLDKCRRRSTVRES